MTEDKAIKILDTSDVGIEYHDIKDLHDLQGDLKFLTPDNYRKLKSSLLKYGFKFPFFVWKDEEGFNWIADGHQRINVLNTMKEEGYKVPKLPCIVITAKDKIEAKKLLLQLNSRYGTYNIDTMYFEDFDSKEFLAEINIPDLDFLMSDFVSAESDYAFPSDFDDSIFASEEKDIPQRLYHANIEIKIGTFIGYIEDPDIVSALHEWVSSHMKKTATEANDYVTKLGQQILDWSIEEEQE